MHTAKQKPVSLLGRLVLILVPVLVLAIVLVGSILYFGRNAVGFRVYEPTNLPTDIHITNQQLDHWSGELQGNEYYTFTSNKHLLISDVKGRAAMNCDEYRSTTNETCSLKKTPKGETYIVVSAYEDGKVLPFSIDYYFNRESTSIDLALINSEDQGSLVNQDWPRVIDSFHEFKNPVYTNKNIVGEG